MGRFKRLPVDKVPEPTAGRRPSLFKAEDVAEALRTLEAGAAVVTAETYEKKERARDHARRLRQALAEASSMTTTARVWQDGERWVWAVLPAPEASSGEASQPTVSAPTG